MDAIIRKDNNRKAVTRIAESMTSPVAINNHVLDRIPGAPGLHLPGWAVILSNTHYKYTDTKFSPFDKKLNHVP